MNNVLLQARAGSFSAVGCTSRLAFGSLQVQFSGPAHFFH